MQAKRNGSCMFLGNSIAEKQLSPAWSGCEGDLPLRQQANHIADFQRRGAEDDQCMGGHDGAEGQSLIEQVGTAYPDQEQQNTTNHQQVAQVQQAVWIERLINHEASSCAARMRPHFFVRARDRYSSAAAGPKNS